VNVAGYEVGYGCPTFIVAEIGQNHNGDVGIAKRLIEMAGRCGADAVMFQKRDIRW
jgi:N-acetylneuraminate synthase